MAVQQGCEPGGRGAAAYIVIAGTLLWGGLVLPSYSQDVVAEEGPTLKSVRELRRQAESAGGLSEGQRNQVLELYDQALKSLETAGRHEDQARRYDRERRDVSRQAAALRDELDRPVQDPGLSLPADASAIDFEHAVAQERAELAARRQALSELERLAETRANRRLEIARRIGTLIQRIEDLDDALRLVTQSESQPEFKEAQRTDLAARRRAARQEIATLRSEQALLDAEAELLPLRRDRAQRRVGQSEHLVELIDKQATEARQNQAERSLEQIQEKCREARGAMPGVAELADEVEHLADTLWGDEGVKDTVGRVTQEITRARGHSAQVQKIAQVTRRKFETVRLRGVASEWWPKIPVDLPQPAEIRRTIRQREILLPEVQHKLIVLEERRQEIGDTESQATLYQARAREVA